MRREVLTAPEVIEREDVTLTPPGPGQVIVEITQCGVCTGDVDKWRGKEPGHLPNLIGHEIGGIVTDVGPGVTRVKVGNHVAPWTPDGRGFAEAMLAQEAHCVVHRPDLVYPAVAEPLACALLTVSYAAHVHEFKNSGQPIEDQHIVIVGGTGFMGTLVLMALRATDRQPRSISVTGRDAARLDQALGFGADHAVNTDTDDLDEHVREITGNRGACITFESTGVGPGLVLAHQITRQAGTVAWYGYHQGGDRSLHIGGINERAHGIANAHWTPGDPRENELMVRTMEAGIRLYEEGRLDPTPLLTHRFMGLDQTPDAFRTADARPEGFMKAVVLMQREATAPATQTEQGED